MRWVGRIPLYEITPLRHFARLRMSAIPDETTLLAETFQRMRTAGRGIRPTQHI